MEWDSFSFDEFHSKKIFFCLYCVSFGIDILLDKDWLTLFIVTLITVDCSCFAVRDWHCKFIPGLGSTDLVESGLTISEH